MKRMMRLEDIIIKESFANTTPRAIKMKECRDYWKEHQSQDRYIVVDRNNVLVDGYVMYLVLKENGIEEAEIRIGKMKEKRLKRWHRKTNADSWDIPEYREKPTTYIIGVHPNSKSEKQYMWRVPNNWTWIAENLQVGDLVFCRTKRSRIAPVIIKEIKVLDRCPVDYPISKMCCKTIRRNGVAVE